MFINESSKPQKISGKCHKQNKKLSFEKYSYLEIFGVNDET